MSGPVCSDCGVALADRVKRVGSQCRKCRCVANNRDRAERAKNTGTASTSLYVTDAEIRRLCSYIHDNAMIANYLGVDRERVAKVRAKMPPPRPIGTARKATDPKEGYIGGALDHGRSAGETGSRDLLRALVRYGLNNDRDLGMGAGRFLALAARLGLHPPANRTRHTATQQGASSHG